MSNLWSKGQDSWLIDSTFNKLTLHPKYSWDGKVLRRERNVVIGNNGNFRKEMFQHFHEGAVGGHSGGACNQA